MKLLLALILCWHALAVPTGGDCSKGAAYCGSVLTVEKLLCDGSKCRGIAGNNNCDTTSKLCTANYFCNSGTGVCEGCIMGCSQCSDGLTCNANMCTAGYWYNPSTKNCDSQSNTYCIYTGTAAATCTSCATGSGYYVSTTTNVCVQGPLNCVYTTALTPCTTCATKMYWDTTALVCANGPSYCDVLKTRTTAIPTVALLDTIIY